MFKVFHPLINRRIIKNEMERMMRKILIYTFLFCLFACPMSHAAPVLKNADIVTANVDTGKGTLILNNGDGTFPLAGNPEILVGNSPVDVSTGDFNEDGWQDLVFVNGGAGGEKSLSFLLGNGNGEFQPRYTFFLGYEASNGVAIGDFNEDGHADIFVPRWSGGSGQVEILIGDGHGGFSRPPASAGATWAVAGRANNVDVGDFNGDGHLDGVVCNYDSGIVTIVFGNGHGGITGEQRLDAKVNQYGLPPQPRNVRVQDFNKDGKDDLVFAHAEKNQPVVEYSLRFENYQPSVPPAGRSPPHLFRQLR